MENICKWILLGEKSHCHKLSLYGGYCYTHNYAMKNKGHVNKVCRICGIGIRGTNGLCREHGAAKARNKKNNSVRDELNRLRKINID